MSPLGRPLEFHCSAPIQTNRAQEILYGPTLRPYLLGDLVGRTLVEHTELPVEVILVDSQEALELRMSVDVPVAAVFSDPAIDPKQASEILHSNPLRIPESTPNQVKIGPFFLVMARGYLEDARLLRNILVPVIRDVDLCEPFERIREALMEAQRMSA